MEIKALVADSNSQVRKNITRSLREIGVRDIVEATDGEQAIELLQSDSYDIVFTEWSTQIGAGEELIKAIRKVDQEMPVIVTVPKSKKMAEVKKCCPSASNYLMTPFSTDQLRKTVAQYVPSLAS